MNYRKQPNNTVLCGMFAIYNGHVWLGAKVRLKDLTEVLWNKLNTDENGICGSYLDPVISRIFKTNKIKFPTIQKVEAILAEKKSIILRYKWVVNENWGTHYCLLYLKGRSIIAVNPHCDQNGNRPIEKTIPKEELKMMLNKCKVGNNQYPWVWPVREAE